MSTAVALMKQLRSLGVQLNLEGDVLRLNAPKGTLTPELQSALRASKPELVELLRSLQQSRGNDIGAPMPTVDRRKQMPLSFAQQRIWFLQQMEPESVAYNLVSMLRMAGYLDSEALEQALHHILLRHEALRTCFVQSDGSPYTIIADGSDWRLQKPTLDRRKGETLEQSVTRFAEETTQKPFNLETGPLFRAYLLKIDAQEHILVLSIHHIVSDGWSMGVFVREFTECYRAFRMKEVPQLAELHVQYVDYAEWQRKWLESGVLERQMKYWTKQLEGAPAVVLFPPDHARASEGNGWGSKSKRVLSEELTSQLEAFSRSHDATMFMTMLTAFMLLLARYSGLKDIVIGSPSANRSRAELSELIGFFVNNLVLRAQLEDGISFLDFLSRVREATLGAYEHQDAPFDQLVRAIQTDRAPEYSPLFQTMFILQNFPLEELKLPDITILPLEVEVSSARFDFTAEIYPFRKQLHIYFDYRADLYDRETIDGLLRDYEHVLQFIVSNPQVKVESIPLMPEAARTELLAWGNETAVVMPPKSLLLNRLERFACETPDRIAARAGTLAHTYESLNLRAHQLAELLRARGAQKGTLVPVCLNRSTDLLVALLAVLKTGAAYVPLDPIYPKHRIADILEDVKPKVLITERALISLVGGYDEQCLLLDETAISFSASSSLQESPTTEDLAYVIFTSGSTGRPKGVEVSHGALANLLDSMSKAPGFTASDRILAVTTVSFDIAGLELFLPIYVGGEVIIALAPSDLPVLLNDLEREKPTVMQATPALWQMLISAGWEGDSRLTALCGGEALTPQLAGMLIPKVNALWNMYGPTETTIWSSALHIEEASGTTIPIGGPIQNTTFHVLDTQFEPVPLGVAGELYIGGAGVARGYLQRPELTAERFVILPFAPGCRLYRTGDLVRRRRDGGIEFLGRADFQVKLRGFRIELGEIEHTLRQQPEIVESVVLLREVGGQQELVAYLVLKPGQTLPYGRLRQRLRDRLPEYMIPGHAVLLERFPRLPNGKLDRSKLPAPVALLDAGHDDLPIGSPKLTDNTAFSRTESAIAAVFRELLHSDRIGVEQRFFDMGAHSLLLVKAHDRLRRELDPNLRLVSLFQFPSIASLAAHIDKSSANNQPTHREIVHAGQQ
jgi:amino acid adenylation domain-containing protein